MFWNKKNSKVENGADPADQKDIKTTRPKKLSKKDILTGQIEMLEQGHTLNYVVNTWSGTDLMVVELNPAYPDKGHKYIVSFEDMTDNRPSGKRQHLADSDKAKQVAEWIISRKGEPYTPENA